MRFEGKIEKLNKIIISDPSYDKDVSCRYERNNLNCDNWKIDIEIHAVEDAVNEDLSIKGKEFFLLLQDPKESCRLKDDGSFSYYSKNKIQEIDIGIDTSCVALGVNSFADEIKSKIKVWHPECALKTLSDGIFGYVKEGTSDNQVNFIWVTGYITDDAGYSFKDLVDYISTQLNVTELVKVVDISEQIKKENNIDYDIDY